MAHKHLDEALMQEALQRLDEKLAGGNKARLVVGGGAALLLAYDTRLTTGDVHAFARKGGPDMGELESRAGEVARDLGIHPDWLNGHFQTLTHVLPMGEGGFASASGGSTRGTTSRSRRWVPRTSSS